MDRRCDGDDGSDRGNLVAIERNHDCDDDDGRDRNGGERRLLFGCWFGSQRIADDAGRLRMRRRPDLHSVVPMANMTTPSRGTLSQPRPEKTPGFPIA